jgi:hypothetical protein
MKALGHVRRSLALGYQFPRLADLLPGQFGLASEFRATRARRCHARLGAFRDKATEALDLPSS